MQVKGLPQVFQRKSELITFIREALWIVVQHSAFSFPIAEYGQTPAIFPTKLYESKKSGDSESFINMLPGPVSTVVSSFRQYVMLYVYFEFCQYTVKGLIYTTISMIQTCI